MIAQANIAQVNNVNPPQLCRLNDHCIAAKPPPKLAKSHKIINSHHLIFVKKYLAQRYNIKEFKTNSHKYT